MICGSERGDFNDMDGSGSRVVVCFPMLLLGRPTKSRARVIYSATCEAM